MIMLGNKVGIFWKQWSELENASPGNKIHTLINKCFLFIYQVFKKGGGGRQQKDNIFVPPPNYVKFLQSYN